MKNSRNQITKSLDGHVCGDCCGCGEISRRACVESAPATRKDVEYLADLMLQLQERVLLICTVLEGQKQFINRLARLIEENQG